MTDRAVADSTCLIVLERIGHGTSPDWLTVRTVRNTAMVAALQTQLGKGESQSIALAAELGEV